VRPSIYPTATAGVVGCEGLVFRRADTENPFEEKLESLARF
jgi:hypothetical protein